MSDIEEVLDFLAERDIHPGGAGDSPWPSYDPDMGDLLPVDYGWLFPSKGERAWSMEEVSHAIEQIMEPLEVDSQHRRGIDDPGEGTTIDADERLADWDTCAWYQQIHFYGRDWGIFIRQDCLIRQAQHIYHAAHYGPPSPPVALEALLASLAIYFLHEHFHHKAESLAIRLQVVQPSAHRYPHYFYDVYNKTLGSDDCLEEALANADSWRRLNEERHKRSISPRIRAVVRRYLESRFPHDPPGYRRASDYLTDMNFRGGLYMLSSQIDETVLMPSRATVGRLRDWYWAPSMSRSLFSWASRIHVIVPPGARPAIPRGPLHHVP